MTSSASPTTVSVLGTGNMGSAIARALLAAGHRTVAWNRTPEKAHALIADGAQVVDTALDALRASELTIVCVASTDAAGEIFDGVTAHDVTDRSVINLTTGTPDDAHALSASAAALGIGYLDGAIGAYPHQIGGEDTLLLVAGDADLWQKYRDVVLALGGASKYTGENPAGANVLDAGLTGAFYMSSLVSFVEAVRFITAAGVPTSAIAELVEYSTGVLAHQMLAALHQIDARDYETDQATVEVFAHTSSAFAEAMASVGDAAMIEATAATFRRAVEAGLGEKDLAVLSTI